MAASTIVSCPVCGFPISAYEGQTMTCASCGTGLIAQGVTIPTPLFAGGLGFFLGVLLGVPLIASTQAGQRWLSKQVSRIG